MHSQLYICRRLWTYSRDDDDDDDDVSLQPQKCSGGGEGTSWGYVGGRLSIELSTIYSPRLSMKSFSQFVWGNVGAPVWVISILLHLKDYSILHGNSFLFFSHFLFIFSSINNFHFHLIGKFLRLCIFVIFCIIVCCTIHTPEQHVLTSCVMCKECFYLLHSSGWMVWWIIVGIMNISGMRKDAVRSGCWGLNQCQDDDLLLFFSLTPALGSVEWQPHSTCDQSLDGPALTFHEKQLAISILQQIQTFNDMLTYVMKDISFSLSANINDYNWHRRYLYNSKQTVQHEFQMQQYAFLIKFNYAF